MAEDQPVGDARNLKRLVHLAAHLANDQFFPVGPHLLAKLPESQDAAGSNVGGFRKVENRPLNFLTSELRPQLAHQARRFLGIEPAHDCVR